MNLTGDNHMVENKEKKDQFGRNPAEDINSADGGHGDSGTLLF